ncbi:MAG: energy-coupling factor ABC transporter ATP-binding protein [Bacillota bacterium]
MANIYTLSGVSYEYGPGAPALRGINLAIAQGESVALLGANASGKTTLLRLLAGLASPTAGAITAFGAPLTPDSLRDRAFAAAFRRRVGFVFQNADAQLFSPTVAAEIAFGPLQLGLDEAAVAARVSDTMALLGIEHLAERAPFHLSGGEKRKVAIGSVLSLGPDVLLFDEPTTGLDPRSRAWLVRFLRALREAGKTIVTATHDLAIVGRLADRAVVLGEDHRVWSDAPIGAVLADHGLLVGTNLAEPGPS